MTRSLEAHALLEAEAIGRDLYDFDQAAWGATDAMAAAIPNPADAGVKGWIVEREPTGTFATFYGRGDKEPYKLFVAHMQGRRVLSQHLFREGEDRSVTDVERRMIAARHAVLSKAGFEAIGVRPCADASLNTVVLPPRPTDNAVAVYILTPQVETSVFPLGGHYRAEVGVDGKILRSRAFAKSCLAVDRSQMPANVQAYGLTHLLDPYPTEIHVWASLATKLPLMVLIMSSREVWQVADGTIRLSEKLRPEH